MRTPPALVTAAALLSGGCATTSYAPQVVARGELVLRYEKGFEMWAGGRRVARALAYKGLAEYVRCVPAAHEHARGAARDGAAAIALSVIGGTLGVAGLGGLYGLHDQDRMWYWLGGGIASATLGAVLAGLGHSLRSSANGRAVDAMNFYNDAVGSLGATCDDLRYPPPAGPAPGPAGPEGGVQAPPALPPPPTVETPAPGTPKDP